jgi:hypothetical protein
VASERGWVQHNMLPAASNSLCTASLPASPPAGRQQRLQQQQSQDGASGASPSEPRGLQQPQVDMAGLYTALHVAKSLGQLDAFRCVGLGPGDSTQLPALSSAQRGALPSAQTACDCCLLCAAVSLPPSFEPRAHYLDQRRLQITADLQPPSNFLSSYQAYLAQV